MFHLRFGLSDHLKALLDFVFGSRRRVKKVRIFRAWFSQFTERDGGVHIYNHAGSGATKRELRGVHGRSEGRTLRVENFDTPVRALSILEWKK